MPDYASMLEAAQGGKRREEKVIYYRKPNGWIVGGDTQPTKQLSYIKRGFEPLEKYGYISNSEDFWGPILRHRDGPAEFVAEQVITFRWYKAEECPVKGIKFPCLIGQSITEFPCPECSRYPFHQAVHLASHLRIMHGYDRAEIIAYGTATGIDFMKIPGGREVVEYQFTAPEPVAEIDDEAEEDGEFMVATVTPSMPLPSNVLFCPDCDYTTVGKKRHDSALKQHRHWKHTVKEAVPA